MEQLICMLKIPVPINTKNLDVSFLTKEYFRKGRPSIKVASDSFNLEIYGKVVGELSKELSSALSSIVKQQLGKFQAKVGLDPQKENHALVIISITGKETNAFSIIFEISMKLKDEFENLVIVSPNMAALPGIHSVIQRNKKRSLPTNTSTVSSAAKKPRKTSSETSSSSNTVCSVVFTSVITKTFSSSSTCKEQSTINVSSSLPLFLRNTPEIAASTIVSSVSSSFPTTVSTSTINSVLQNTQNNRFNKDTQKVSPIPIASSQSFSSSQPMSTGPEIASEVTVGTSSKIAYETINTTLTTIKQEKRDPPRNQLPIDDLISGNSFSNSFSTGNFPSNNVSTSTSKQNSSNVSINMSSASEELYNYDRRNFTDLPENIMEKIDIFSRDEQAIRAEQNELNLLYESSSRGTTCNFLLGRDPLPQPTSSQPNNVIEISPNLPHEDSDDAVDSDNEEISFSANMRLRRRRRKRNPTAHIGADANELLEDPADVAYRHYGLEAQGPDIADVMFTNVPEPVVKKNKLDELFDLMSEMPQNMIKEPCAAVIQTMLPHQKMALHWMVARENTEELPPFWECIVPGRDYFNTATLRRGWEKPECVRGGMLADDMGLGKTLTAIALILTNHINGEPMFKKVSDQAKQLPLTADDIDEPDAKKLSIKKKKEGYLKPSKTTKSDMMKPGFRFRQMYKSELTKTKGKKKVKVKKEEPVESTSLFSDDSGDESSKKLADKHIEHIIRNHFPSANEGKRRTFSQSPDRRATLIICPMSVLSNWTTQFQAHIDPTIDLQIYVFYGPERVREVQFLRRHDIILTTYGTLTNDYKAREKKLKRSPLHEICWLRIILDEGHIIRNARSQQTAAVMGLNSARKWLLTGTPIQNRMTDLWSILKFLRLEPFTNRRWWFKYVVESMKRKPKPGELVFNRVQKIIRHIAIRRMKTDEIEGEPIVKLPERKIVIQKIKFSEDERKLYDAMQKDGKLVICKYFRMNAVMKNYANVLAIIMRLRQLCCHPNLCIKAVKKLQQAMEMMEQLGEQVQAEEGAGDEDGNGVISEAEREKLIEQLMQLLSTGDSEECSICLEQLTDPIITKCAHVFCQNCINEVIDTSENGATCPLCRADIDQSTMVKVPQRNAIEEDGESENSAKDDGEKVGTDNEEWHSSAKLDALMEVLLMQRQDNPRMKSLVVSQFTSFLDVIEKPLREHGFQFVRLDGTMSQGRRTRVIDEFQSDSCDSPTIMLLSLTAGGVGLNLVAANRVFLLDPAWNPAIEEQCFDRCHRLGQKKDVLIIKFIVEDTVEDRMLILQKQKRELMERAFGISQASPEERRAAALRDIATLLGIDFGRAGRRRNPGDPNMPGPSSDPQDPPRAGSPIDDDLPVIPLGRRNVPPNRRNVNV